MITTRENRSAAASPGFTLVEILVAVTISIFVLAAVLAANLQIVRGGVRLSQYVEIDSQVRRALEMLSRDLKAAKAITWNSSSDITLTLPLTDTTTTQVTYAWTDASGTFFRVAGASSTTLVGRLELIRGIATLPDGTAGLVFARFDRDGQAATTDAATKSIQVNMTVARNPRAAGAGSTTMVSATYTLRSKPIT